MYGHSPNSSMFSPAKVSLYTVFGFCDASTIAYVAVIAVIVEITSSGKRPHFAVSKTCHVSSLEAQTVPRLLHCC